MTPPVPDLPIHASIIDAQRSAGHGQPVALAVRVATVRSCPRRLLHLCGPGGYPYQIYLRDLAADRDIDTRPTTDLELVGVADQLLRRGGQAVAHGRFAPDPTRGKPRPGEHAAPVRFVLEHLTPAVELAGLLGTQPDERERARALLARLRAQGDHALRDHLIREVAGLHGFHLDRLPPRFHRFLHLILLQAASEGQVAPGASGRLSTYTLSEPGQGKGLLAAFAEDLSPVAAIVTPDLFTLPGLSVKMEQREGQGLLCTPGALARSHRGTTILHDLHGNNPRTRRTGECLSALMSVAEEGVFHPAKGSAFPYLAETALHINGNHRHAVQGRPCPDGLEERLADIGLRLDLFSRIDFVGALCVGDQIEQVAQEVATSRMARRGPAEIAAEEAKRRELRVLMAELRDATPVVDLAPVEEQIAEVVAQAQQVVAAYAAQAGDEAALVPAALSVRMARSVRKVVAASARLRGQAVAGPPDVVVAAEMAALKLETVRWLCGDGPEVVPLGTLAQQAQWAQAEHEARRHRMMEAFGGQVLGEEQLAAGLGEGRRVVRWDLRQMGIAPVEGRYAVPTPLEWQQRLEAAELRGEEIRPAPAPREEDLAPKVAVPHRFVDTLPRIPVGMRPVVRALWEMSDPDDPLRPWDTAEGLLKYATEAELDIAMTLGTRTLVGDPLGDLSDALRPAVYEMEAGLRDRDQGRRAGLALALYTSAPNLPSLIWHMNEALKRDDLPEVVRRHLRSAINRRIYIEERQSRGEEVKLAL